MTAFFYTCITGTLQLPVISKAPRCVCGFEEVFLSSAIGPIQHAARKVKLSPELANVVRLVQHLGWAWSNEYAQGIGPTTFSARSAQVPGRKQQGGNFAILPSAPGEPLQDNTGMGPLPSDVGTQARLKEFDFTPGWVRV